MTSLLRDKFVRSEIKFETLLFVSKRRNSVFDGLRSSLFKFIQERMSLKVMVRISRDRAELLGVEKYVQLVVISVQMIFEGFFEITEPRGVV